MTLCELEQRMVRLRRLLCEHVEAGAGELAGGQRRMQRRFVDNAAARGVDEIGRRLHPAQPGGVEHADRLRRFRAVDADEIGARQRGIEIADRLGACGGNLRGRLERVVDQNVHLHRQAPLHGARADAAEADDDHGLAEQVEWNRA